MTIYTKRGDKGETGLLGKLSSQERRISKDSLIINTIGAVDEVNSFLGIISSNADPKLKEILKEIQGELFLIGSVLAGAKLRFYSTKTEKLERRIDKMEKTLPPLKNFIFPSGIETGAKLHFSRSLTRRAERMVVRLSKKEKVKPQIIKYLNRLSDFLFILARKANSDAKIKEEIWKSG